MNNDIAGLLCEIKENIEAVEANRADKTALSSIECGFLDLMELVKLFLISERDAYYGYFLMNMQFRANFAANCIAGIKLGEFPPVLEANPLLLCKFGLKEILYIICHEIDHVVLNHPAEMVKANPNGDSEVFERFNLAADAAVNDRINREIVAEKRSFLKQPKGLITSGVLAKKFGLGKIRAMESYAYYFNLIKDFPPGNDGKNGQESIMGEISQNSRNGQSGASEGGEETPGGESIVTAQNCGELKDHNWGVGSDFEDAAASVRELVNSAVTMMNEESRGLMPGHFFAQVEAINKPPVLSWQAILKKYVGTIAANKKKTRTRLNRRQPERFDLSGEVDDKVLKIVVAIDTSASVNDSDIGRIMNEIFAILAKRKHDITVIECDAEVQRVYKAKTPADIKKKVAGRGGTMFSPVIEHVNSDRYYRDALLIYFTDGYGEDKIPKPRTYRNIWVVFENVRHLSLKEPYGAVLTL